MMHWPGIEPGPPAWQARILPTAIRMVLTLHSTQKVFFSMRRSYKSGSNLHVRPSIAAVIRNSKSEIRS